MSLTIGVGINKGFKRTSTHPRKNKWPQRARSKFVGRSPGAKTTTAIELLYRPKVYIYM